MVLSAAAGLCTGQWLSDEVVDLSPVGKDKLNTEGRFIYLFLSLQIMITGKLRAGAPDLQDFVKLVLVLHNQDVGLTVGGHILTSFGRVGRVNSSCQTPITQIRYRRIKS